MSASTGTHPGEFESFVRARTGPLLRAAYFLTGDQHLAEDLVQAALARTHRSWESLHATAAAEAYTRRTMYHLQVSWWRRRRVAETLTGELPVHAHPAGDVADSAAMQVTLRSVLLRLPPRQRAVLVLRFFEDLTEAQAAQALGVTVGTVKSQTAKALAKLRTAAPELRDFYSGASAEVKPVDLHEQALASSRRIASRRTAISSAAVAVLLMAVTVTLTLLIGRRGQPAPTTTPSPSLAPSPVVLPAPQPDRPDWGRFRNATITVPAWGGPRRSECHSGRLALNAQAGFEAEGKLPVWVSEQVEVDLDADGVTESVAILHCSEGPESPGTEVVAYRLGADGKLALVGRIIGTRDGFGMIHHLSVAPDGVIVELSKDYTDTGQQNVPFQRRTFRLVGGAFRQVAGPTSFAPNPAFATLAVRTTDLSLRPAAGGSFVGRLTVTAANTGTLDVSSLALHLRLPSWIHPAGPGWTGCTGETTGSPISLAVICPIPGPEAGGTVTVDLVFTADQLPAELNPSPEYDWQSPYGVSIEQRPPYTYEQGYYAGDADFRIVRVP
ncbi:RNA polymerase sigma-70 factor (sigma-E family) [Allocatelliglobosispora scoriae]|uniref:RNA polymerase sigma-70 factor (Sigma-E family) n=1 Tax=Allocatelliglobosispora scoriae TaxID=643052 RepID=A0A841BKM0_9ACTN|nr:RNA polymerase sigma-70 factor (sigma-E family) [Allocatelliglobosispora scoriae]